MPRPPNRGSTTRTARSPHVPRHSSSPLTILRRVAAGVIVVLVVLLSVPVAFIGINCYSADVQAPGGTQDTQQVLADVVGYSRDESATYLTLPEWYIVYSTEEYASFIKDHPPSSFPYFGAIRQYWTYYDRMCHVTKGTYTFNPRVHLMLAVIGVSFSIENGLKGIYENTFGRAAEFIASSDTEEDAFASRAAQEYGRFMHTIPWYEFPFTTTLKRLWRETSIFGPHLIRKWERKVALSLEYTAKGAYGWIIKRSTGAVYEPADLQIHAWIENTSEAIFADPRIQQVKALTPGSYIIRIPRYEAFTDIVTTLAGQGVRFLDVAGNDVIVLTATAPRMWQLPANTGVLRFDEASLTSPDTKRIAVELPVRSLHATLPDLKSRGVLIEHLYDY